MTPNLPATITQEPATRQAAAIEPVPVVTVTVTGNQMSMREALLRVAAHIGVAAGTYVAGVATAAYALSHR